jgi:hypothetical protein
MVNVQAISARLSRPESQHGALLELLHLHASGVDIAPASDHVVRHILFASVATDPNILSLAYDALIAAPSSPHWVDTLSSLTKALGSPARAVAAVALSKIPALPHPALAHIALVAATPLLAPLLDGASYPAPVRVCAVHAAAALVLRERPITAEQLDPIRLDPLAPGQLAIVRTSVARALESLVGALADPHHDAVVLAALGVLTHYASSADAVPHSSVLRATTEATATFVWDLLLPRAPAIAARLARIATGNSFSSATSTSTASRTSSTPPVEGQLESSRLYDRRSALRSLARLAAHALSGSSVRVGSNPLSITTRDDSEGALEANESAEGAAHWAVEWTERVLTNACDDQEWRLASTAATAILVVCSFASIPSVADKRARWGVKAITRLTRILGEHGRKMSSLLSTAITKDAFRGIAALSKDANATSKFVVATAIGLLPHAASCPRLTDRLEALTVLSSTVIEFDLSGRDASASATTSAPSLTAITSSAAWRDIFSSAVEDSTTASEIVCCFGQALLDASRKIVVVKDSAAREFLMSCWASMLAKLLQRTASCLSWPYSSASSFAKEMFLKTFEALGQYSAFLTRTRGMGMEVYEGLQEMLVVAAVKQKDVNTRAALLICVTKYWIPSALKAEANAGHVMKAVWKHAQEHYCDDEVMLKELQTGALWSDAQAGCLTPAQRATEGGYVSLMTALSKRTRAVVDTVSSTVTNVVEATLFGSVALATAAQEGSTLTTDYAYTSLAALLALVHRNPTFAEKAIELARDYIAIMNRAESTDLLVLEATHNTIASLQMYMDEFFPKPVPARPDMAVPYADNNIISSDPHAWLLSVTQSCVFATSRLDDPSKESITVSTEESVLHASTVARSKMLPLNPGTLQNREPGVKGAVEGDQQTLSGAADPFGVVASHTMDTVKALATLRIDVVNRSAFHVSTAYITFSAAGALAPLLDAPTKFSLGSLSPGASSTERVTLSVRHNQGFAAHIMFKIHVEDDGRISMHNYAEQPCLPYYIPSSDVLLLRRPPESAGVDVFRRRWDFMREASKFHVAIRKNQDLDGLVDTLERRSGCLREVGRMRVSSHVSAMVADSSRGDYIALAALAPEARGPAGTGPCLVYVTIRSNSAAYSDAFRKECREWLSSRFKVVVLDDDPNQALKIQALHPQDAFFSNDSRGLTDYQRWRAAHADRTASA